MASDPSHMALTPGGAGNIPKLLLTPREAAEALSVCPKTLYNLTRCGELRAVKIGRAVRYAVDDLQTFIEAMRGGTR